MKTTLKVLAVFFGTFWLTALSIIGICAIGSFEAEISATFFASITFAFIAAFISGVILL
jgi:hypothetical protein